MVSPYNRFKKKKARDAYYQQIANANTYEKELARRAKEDADDAELNDSLEGIFDGETI